MVVNHPNVLLAPYWWRHDPPKPNKCWVCGEETVWVYLDIGYQHIDCDKYPSEEGNVTIIQGEKTID